MTAFAPLYNARLIDPKEFIRLVYRFVAETAPEKIGEYIPVNVRRGRGPGSGTGRGGGNAKLQPNNPGDPLNDPNEVNTVQS